MTWRLWHSFTSKWWLVGLNLLSENTRINQNKVTQFFWRCPLCALVLQLWPHLSDQKGSVPFTICVVLYVLHCLVKLSLPCKWTKQSWVDTLRCELLYSMAVCLLNLQAEERWELPGIGSSRFQWPPRTYCTCKTFLHCTQAQVWYDLKS